jgi:hypothetical protein
MTDLTAMKKEIEALPNDLFYSKGNEVALNLCIALSDGNYDRADEATQVLSLFNEEAAKRKEETSGANVIRTLKRTLRG